MVMTRDVGKLGLPFARTAFTPACYMTIRYGCFSLRLTTAGLQRLARLPTHRAGCELNATGTSSVPIVPPWCHAIFE